MQDLRFCSPLKRRRLSAKRFEPRSTNAAFESPTSRGPAPARPRDPTNLQWPVNSIDIGVLDEPSPPPKVNSNLNFADLQPPNLRRDRHKNWYGTAPVLGLLTIKISAL